MLKSGMMWRALILGVTGFLCAGCAHTEMSLKRLDQDIPIVLVDRYSKSEAPYADKGELTMWPFVFCDEYVAKTASGFEAFRTDALGPILLMGEVRADFDREGRLVRHESEYWLALGLLNHDWSLREKGPSGYRQGGGWSVGWGVFGYEREIGGARLLKVLWVPIPLWRTERNEGAAACE